MADSSVGLERSGGRHSWKEKGRPDGQSPGAPPRVQCARRWVMVGCYGMLRWVHLRKVTWAAGWKATVWVGKFDSSLYILIRLDFVGSDAFVPVENMGGIECFRFGSMDLGCLGDPPQLEMSFRELNIWIQGPGKGSIVGNKTEGRRYQSREGIMCASRWCGLSKGGQGW